MEIKLGAITNISWSFDMREINFKKVPYHCKVDLTVRDLYSVMSQLSYTANNEEYVEAQNSDITTKDEYIRRFVRTKDKKVPNEKYYLTEFAKIPAYLDALERMQADEAKAAEDAKKDSTANGSGAVTKGDTGKVNHDGTKSGAETGTAEKAAEIKTDPKTGKKSLVQSIGGFVTSVTKNIKNVIADVNKAIQRAFVKCCGRFGLGLYIYQGEDLPGSEKIVIDFKSISSNCDRFKLVPLDENGFNALKQTVIAQLTKYSAMDNQEILTYPAKILNGQRTSELVHGALGDEILQKLNYYFGELDKIFAAEK